MHRLKRVKKKKKKNNYEYYEYCDEGGCGGELLGELRFFVFFLIVKYNYNDY